MSAEQTRPPTPADRITSVFGRFPVNGPALPGRVLVPIGSRATFSTLGEGQLRTAPVFVDRRCVVDALGIACIVAGSAGAVFRLGLYEADETGWYPTTLIVDAGTVDCTTTGEKYAVLGTPVALERGWYHVAGVQQGAPVTAPGVTGITSDPLTISHVAATNALSATMTGYNTNPIAGALPGPFVADAGLPSASFGSPRVGLRVIG